MSEITLVLPFALPPPELAPDLVRALQAPGLAALLTRSATQTVERLPQDARILPHELWLARALGLAQSGNGAFARAAMRGFGLDPGDGTWFIVNPAHIEIARNHLLMSDTRRLGLSEIHARALFEAAKPYFDESGKTLLYAAADTWFMRADDWAAMETASPDAACGMNLTDWMPAGERAISYRKLQNEVQMLWYQHPANEEREARGLPAINGFWPWARSAASASLAGAPLYANEAPPWMAAMAAATGVAAEQMLAAGAGSTILYCGSAAEAGIAAEWSDWLRQMQRLDELWFAPLQAALASGRLGQLRLVLGHRDALLIVTVTRMSQRKFWRRPTLNRLLP